MAVTISSLSAEYVRVPIEGTEDGVVVDPTASLPQFAFITGTTEPVADDWNTGEWETETTVYGTVYYARILIGTGGVVLSDGKYRVWCKWTVSPETPVRRVGVLVIE